MKKFITIALLCNILSAPKKTIEILTQAAQEHVHNAYNHYERLSFARLDQYPQIAKEFYSAARCYQAAEVVESANTYYTMALFNFAETQQEHISPEHLIKVKKIRDWFLEQKLLIQAATANKILIKNINKNTPQAEIEDIVKKQQETEDSLDSEKKFSELVLRLFHE